MSQQQGHPPLYYNPTTGQYFAASSQQPQAHLGAPYSQPQPAQWSQAGPAHPMPSQPGQLSAAGQHPSAYPGYQGAAPAPGMYGSATPAAYPPGAMQQHPAGAVPHPHQHQMMTTGGSSGQPQQTLDASGRYIYASWPPPPNPSMSAAVATEDRPFACPLCPKSFSRDNDLKRHIEGHTGDKPYACSKCKNAYARKDALKRHKDTSGHS
ncbi:hypothetical protein BKA62DRAFT_5697 [Auriculariales sp. MPI-PUGE-AT-0066]|nr:hypothetical protein BKA62DRAFT_5697 [Auriculariales sp. MPI-PUGE-AT-0066]